MLNLKSKIYNNLLKYVYVTKFLSSIFIFLYKNIASIVNFSNKKNYRTRMNCRREIPTVNKNFI